jgi:hypothetical protein
MNNEFLALVKSLMSAKTSVILFGVLAVLVAINGNTISNSINGQQASAINLISANSLADIIKEKVASAINQSTSTINKSIGENNQQSTNVNCVNNKCITTICVNNECHTTTTNDGTANSASINIGSITLGQPFYKQDDKRTSQKAVIINGTRVSEVTFAGTGITNGISFTDTGKALVVPKGGGVIYIQGSAQIRTNVTDENATYRFLEIGKSGADGTLRASGAAFFGSDATGKLAFLNNTVAVYKDQIDKAGNGKVIAWRWQ